MLYLGLASSMLCFLRPDSGAEISERQHILDSTVVWIGVWTPVLCRLLHEELTVRMLIGCALMFAAAIPAEWTPKRKSN